MNDGEFKILIVDDEPNIRSGLCKGLQGLADRVDVASHGEDGLEKFARTAYDLVITDLRLPGSVDGLGLLSLIHDQAPDTVVIVITAFGSVETAVEAMRRGAFDFVTKPVDLNMIRQQVRKAWEHCRLKKENRLLREQLEGEGEIPEMVGNCAATRDVLRQIRQVASTDATVLLSGESGTGKELAARAIHQLSPRKDQPFVAVHLGALPDTLLESELFGYEKGAFTGAQGRKTGRFEAANGGTVFLDEITEMSAKSQVDLLRVLEQREIRRLGGEDVIPLDLRVISATNKDLDRLVADGAFREDIYYRLNVVPIRIPPLRRRREDVPVLVDLFLTRFCRQHDRRRKQLAPDAMEVMQAYAWPGNIRQLRNVLERMVVTIETDVIRADQLPSEMRATPGGMTGTLADVVELAEKEAIRVALEACQYHRERTAQTLDISLRTLHYKMSRYGLH
jgi:DNA-binding NtrC family response regulator